LGPTEFVGFEPLVCADDADAIKRAQQLLSSQDIELWCGARFVIRLEHKSKD